MSDETKAAIPRATLIYRRGIASLSPERRKEIASMGGKVTAAIPGHMSRIGKIGGSKKKNPKQHVPDSVKTNIT